MNLKGFKKTHDDEHKAVLSHKNGHKIEIAKKGLSKKRLEELSDLPLHASEGADIEQTLNNQADFKDQAMAADPIPVQEDQSRGLQGAESAPQEQQPAPQLEQAVAPMAAEQPAAQPQPQPVRPHPEQEKQQYVQQHTAGTLDESGKFAQDVNVGHITPKTYSDFYNDKSTLGKIGSIFGLLLSGAGSGLAHQPNMALQMMDKEIDRDLEAQTKSAANAQNYLRLNQENELRKAQIKETQQRAGLTGAQTQETSASARIKEAQLQAFANAQIQPRIVATHYLQSQVDKLPPGPQKAQGQQIVTGLKAAVAQRSHQIAQQAAEASANDPEGEFQARQKQLMSMGMLGMSGGEAIAQNEAQKHVPGIGDASIAVPGDVRKELIAHQKLQNAAEDALQYSKSHTNLIPGTKEYNVGTQKALILQQMVREGLLGTVFRESEKPLLNKFVDENPAGVLKMLSTQPKLKSLLESNAMAGNALREAYGLPTKSHSNQQPEVRYDKDGNAWQLGPNGKPVKVKK